MRTVYFDCFSGISGDMTLGALVDAGVSIDALRAGLSKLSLPGYELKVEKVNRSGIAATKAHVIIDRKDQKSRHLSDILDIIEGSSLSPTVKEKSSLIFKRMAAAEAKVHGTIPDEIHFHEVGAVDAVVDIVGSVIGLDLLEITQIIASAVNVGSGTVHTSHGIFPIPAPATAELLKGIPFYQSSTQFELATPTGAAIISTLSKSFGPLPAMKVDRIAYGAGDKDFPDRPNILRLMIGELAANYEEDTSIVIETNIDDMSPQVYDYIIERLMEQGAQDVYLSPIIMKKGRPAILLSVLTERSKTDALLDIVFHETTSIGARIHEVGRKKLSREIKEVDTIYGRVGVKISRRGKEILTVTPEYDDCRRIAEEKKVPLKKVMEEAKKQFLNTES
ncbi:MAG TPA: nickel pincer cofactor biosynthesis protein LarC [Nitrospirota bacterium]|nr:nickel pincer cofactor biosynthesis protein LarC [Nitrospirota bacterium]